MDIRGAHLGDEEGLVQLFAALDSESPFMLYGLGDRETSIQEQALLIQSFAQSNSSILMIAEEESQIVGYISGHCGTAPRDHHALVLALGVIKPYWGKSVGKALLNGLERWAKARGVRRMELAVVEENIRARKLYEKVGFEYEGTRRNSFLLDGHLKNELWMGKLL